MKAKDGGSKEFALAPALVKTGIGWALRGIAGDRLIATLSGVSQQPLVLGYHRVVDSIGPDRAQAIRPMLVSRRMFERQLDWIGRRYRFVSLDELGARLAEGRTEPVAAVTFDDGYRDVYDHAFPVLMRKGIPAAIFVVTDWLGSSGLLNHDRLYLLLARNWSRSADILARFGMIPSNIAAPRCPFTAMRRLLAIYRQEELARVIALLEEHVMIDAQVPEELRPLTWEMLSAMHSAGMIIGSHTQSHPLLTHEGPGQIRDELASSRSLLERRLGARVRHFAYPDGAFDAGIVTAVASAGYQFAYTCCGHRDMDRPQLTIPRRFLWENSCLDAIGRFSPALLACLTNGVFDFARGCRQRHGALSARGN